MAYWPDKVTIAHKCPARQRIPRIAPTPTYHNGGACEHTMTRNLRRFHAQQIKDGGRRYYDKSFVAQKLVLEKELQYPQNILPFFVKPFLSALH
jgi:hypothetical protein